MNLSQEFFTTMLYTNLDQVRKVYLMFGGIPNNRHLQKSFFALGYINGWCAQHHLQVKCRRAPFDSNPAVALFGSRSRVLSGQRQNFAGVSKLCQSLETVQGEMPTVTCSCLVSIINFVQKCFEMKLSYGFIL